MSLENSLKKIRSFILARYKNNLASILVFGTAHTGEFREGKSDIDTMIFLKRKNRLDFDKEMRFLFNALNVEHFSTQYFHTLGSIKQYIRERGSWSTYITIVSKDGSIVLYSTPEFEETRKWLKEHPIPKQALRKYLREKDKFELDGYFRKRKGFNLTKAFMGHMQRKLQIINHFLTGEFIFNYNACLENADLTEEKKERLRDLHHAYEKRRGISNSKVEDYYDFAKQLTTKISQKCLS